MKILVSGATGFMGSAITRHLLAAGHEVRAMSRSAERARGALATTDKGRDALAAGTLTVVSADVTQPATLPTAVEGVDAIVQAAQFAGAPVEDAKRGLTYMEVDRNGTMHLLDAVAEVYGARTSGPGLTRFPNGAPWFVYLSGVTVSEHSPNFWDRAKWQAEEAIRGSGLDWTIVRASWTYGPDDRSLNRLIGYARLLPFVPTFGNGQERVTPLFIEDLGRFFALVLDGTHDANDATFPLGGPDVMTMNDILRTALQVAGKRRAVLHVPKAIGRLQGAALQLLPGQLLSPGAVDFVAQGGVADSTLVRGRFPEFQPMALRPALETYARGTR
jgi:NADH dehydrogenase